MKAIVNKRRKNRLTCTYVREVRKTTFRSVEHVTRGRWEMICKLTRCHSATGEQTCFTFNKRHSQNNHHTQAHSTASTRKQQVAQCYFRYTVIKYSHQPFFSTSDLARWNIWEQTYPISCSTLICRMKTWEIRPTEQNTNYCNSCTINSILVVGYKQSFERRQNHKTNSNSALYALHKNHVQ